MYGYGGSYGHSIHMYRLEEVESLEGLPPHHGRVRTLCGHWTGINLKAKVPVEDHWTKYCKTCKKVAS